MYIATEERGIDLTHINNTHEAYKFYLCAKWETDKRPVFWTNRIAPKWRTIASK